MKIYKIEIVVVYAIQRRLCLQLTMKCLLLLHTNKCYTYGSDHIRCNAKINIASMA
jgi:hypothetical protein